MKTTELASGGVIGSKISEAIKAVSGRDSQEAKKPETRPAGKKPIINLETLGLIVQVVAQAAAGLSVDHIVKIINEVVDAVYYFCLNTALPTIESFHNDAERHGPAVLLNKVRRDAVRQCEDMMRALRDYSLENHERLLAEVEEFPHKSAMVAGFCERVAHAVALAEFVFQILSAKSRQEMEKVFAEGIDGVKKKAVDRVAIDPKKDQLMAWKIAYGLTPNAFEGIRALAEEQIFEAVRQRCDELTSAMNTQEEVLPSEDEVLYVSPEELFFGDDEKTFDQRTKLRWSYGGKENELEIVRQKHHLYLVGAEGDGVQRELRAMEEKTNAGDCPFILLSDLLNEEGLIRGKKVTEEGKTFYDLAGIKIPQMAFKMVLFILTGLHSCCPDKVAEFREVAEQPA